MSLENSNSEYLKTLSGESTITYFLRAMYGLSVDYGVFLASNLSEQITIVSKSQLAFLMERGFSDSLVKNLPELALRGMFQPLSVDEFDYPDDIKALFIEATGTFLTNMARALNPNEPQVPEWWDAPVSFAICSRGILRLNPTSIQKFGKGLERLNAKNLPLGRDEFIVRVEGPERSRFITFKKLRPSIFSLEDCTEDLTEAQDITWWASVGKACVKEIENNGGKWKHSATLPDPKNQKDNQKILNCDWNGQSQGYLIIEEAQPPKTQLNNINFNEKLQQKNSEFPETNLETNFDSISEDSEHVISNIGPQAMALLSAGQTHDNNYENYPKNYEVMI